MRTALWISVLTKSLGHGTYEAIIGCGNMPQLTVPSDREEARLISLAWSCAENVYKTDAATEAMEELANSGLNVEWSIPSSTLGTVKATTFTTYTSDPTSAPHLIIAVRGSASRLDHIVNLNSEPRDAGVLFVSDRSGPLERKPVFLIASRKM